MQIPLIVGLIPLFLGPVLGHSVFRKIFVVERGQIAVDNSGILLGTGDRALWRRVERINRELESMERFHHVAHRCARLAPTPEARASCAATDRTIELAIRTRMKVSAIDFARTWWETRAAAERELQRLGVRDVTVVRSVLPPLSEKFCLVCRLKVGWEIDSKGMDSHLHSADPAVESVHVGWVKEESLWRYRFE